MDFKVTYLDGGLGAMTDRSGLLSDSDFVMRCQRSRRYKTQVRDHLITTVSPGQVIPPPLTPNTVHHHGHHGHHGTTGIHGNQRQVSKRKQVAGSDGTPDSDGRYSNSLQSFSDSTTATAMTDGGRSMSGAVTYPHHSPHAGTIGTAVPPSVVGSGTSVYSPYAPSDHQKMFSNGTEFSSYHPLDRSSSHHYHHHHSPQLTGSSVPSVPSVTPGVGSIYSPYNGDTSSLSSYAANLSAANLFNAAIDHTNPRTFLTGDFLHSYRHAAALGTYYPEYHGSVASAYSAGNGFLSDKDSSFRTANDHRSYFPVTLQ